MSDETFHDAAAARRERDYLLRRADDHRRLADKAAEPHIRATHLSMQRLYQKRADHPGLILND